MSCWCAALFVAALVKCVPYMLLTFQFFSNKGEKSLIVDGMLDWVKEQKKVLFREYSRTSYSQEGEDLLLERHLSSVQNGFYLEVGAHHPFRFSNTYLFYQRGWSGLCIDANPESMTFFKKFRPRDLCVEVGVSDQEGILDYYVFNDKALNTFSSEKAKFIQEKTDYRLFRKLEVPVKPLNTILESHLPAHRKIDFLTLDIEGFDLKVLRTLDWKKYSPTFVVVEDHLFALEDPGRSEIHQLMTSEGYQLVSKLYISLIYKKR